MDQYNFILDPEIDYAFSGSDFGGRWSNREIMNNALLKYAAGYHTGRTLKNILIELKLITQKSTLTKRGKELLYLAYSKDLSL